MMDYFDSIRFEPEGRSLECRASIGSATMDDETDSVDEILSRADESMYEVKSHRRSRP
jgi:GGDEF domain-containing protein